MEENNNSKIRKVLFNEISLIISILAVVFGIFIYINKPNEIVDVRLKLIEENHIPHLEEAIEKLIMKDARQDEMIQEINIKLERILTILEK